MFCWLVLLYRTLSPHTTPSFWRWYTRIYFCDARNVCLSTSETHSKLRIHSSWFSRKSLNRLGFRSTLTQAGILTGLTHAHVVEMRGFYKWEQAYCLAMERMEGGELCEDIIRRVFYSEACARRVRVCTTINREASLCGVRPAVGL